MKAVIRMKTKGFDDGIGLVMTLTRPNGGYTREEMQRWKTKLETKIHAVLVEDGYPPSAIRFK